MCEESHHFSATILPASPTCKACRQDMKYVTPVFTWKCINIHSTDVQGYNSSSIIKFYYEGGFWLSIRMF